MDSVHAFPPHNASYRLNHLSFFCIYGGLRRQNKQAATDGSHKKAPPPVAGFAKKRTARKFHFFPVFHSEKSKKSKTTSRLSARGARIRSRNDAAQQPRSAGDTAVVDTHCAGAGPPRLRRQTECAAPIRAESRVSHRRRREGRGRKHTRFRPSDADAGKSVFRHRARPDCAAALRQPKRRRRRAAAVFPCRIIYR